MQLKTWTRNERRVNRLHETVAAARINLNLEEDRRYTDAVVSMSKAQAQTAWHWFEKIGTIHKAVSRSARIAGYARLRLVEVRPDGGDGDTIEDDIVNDVMASLYSPFGGTRGLIDRFYSLMKVPGDSYLIRVRDEDGPDGFHFLSSDEIDRESTGEAALAPPGTKRNIRWTTLPPSQMTGSDSSRIEREVDPKDVLGRVWLPGRRYVDLPDSPIFALSTECETLHTLTLAIRGRLRSRFVLSNALYIPNSITEVYVQGTGKSMDILDFLDQAMRANVQNYDDASVALPILFKGQDDAGDKIVDIKFDREIFETDLNMRREMIEEILFGLDIQKQATKGEGANVSRWGAWTMTDEEVRVAVQPDLDVMCWALTRLIVQPALKELGWKKGNDAEILKHRVAWDMSESAVRTNKQDDFRQLFDRGLLSGKALQMVSGASPTDAAPSEAEYIRWVGGQRDNVYLQLVDDDMTLAKIDWDEVEKYASTAPGPESTKGSETDPREGPGVGPTPGSPNDKE